MAELVGLRWGPASKGMARQLVVLCHGVGADGHDLIDLAPTWSRALPDALFVAPDAPEPYDQGPTGRQWFSLQDRTPAALDAAARRAAPALQAYIDAELAQAALPPDAVAMMGFSQGAMMVLYAGLRRRPPPRGILAYSGALLETPGLAAECAGHPPVLLVHGEQDDVVPFARAGAAESALVRLGIPVQTLWCPRLGHGIDDAGLSAGVLFLQRLFA
jgi:phospholipase/carboxylesterase